MVLLRTIDSLWVYHLTEVDDMRRGIGLRGYAQPDPLNEFRREASRLHQELAAQLTAGVAPADRRRARRLSRAGARQAPPREVARAGSLAQGLASLAGSGGNGAGVAQPALAG